MGIKTIVEGRDMCRESCIVCGVEFYYPAPLYDAALQRRGPNGLQIYCPNGHTFHYVGESDEEGLRRKLDIANQRIARAEQEASEALREKEKAEARIKRLMKRAGNGACPCCNRHFVNLERHMKTKHSNVVKLKDVA